jgi:hypothetical protein
MILSLTRRRIYFFPGNSSSDSVMNFTTPGAYIWFYCTQPSAKGSHDFKRI